MHCLFSCLCAFVGKDSKFEDGEESQRQYPGSYCSTGTQTSAVNFPTITLLKHVTVLAENFSSPLK